MTTPNRNSPTPVPGVEAHNRLEVLPRHFGRLMLVVESAVYFWALTLCEHFRGQFWNFYEFGEGGFYMAPEGGAVPVEVEGGGFEGVLSADAFGITCCLCALSNLSFQVGDETVGRHLHLLRAFALDHPEARLIFQALAGSLID